MKRQLLIVMMLLAISSAMQAQDWTLVNIGDPGVEPAVVEEGSSISFEAGGRGLRTPDELSFLYVENASGKQITVDAPAIEALGRSPQAGLMWRASLEGTSVVYALSVFNGKLYLTKRSEEAGTLGKKVLKNTVLGSDKFRMAWTEEGLSFSVSANGGDTWELLATEAAAETGFMGLFATSGQRSVLGKTVFSGVEYGDVELLDAWASINFQGAKDAAYGSSFYDFENQSFVLEASGTGFASKNDQFHYVFIELAEGADFVLVAKVNPFTATSNNAMAALTARDDLSGNSSSETIGFRFDKSIRTLSRSETAAAALIKTPAKKQLFPQWLKLEKSGNTLKSFYSADGENWSLGAESSPAWQGSYYVGLGGTSANKAATVTMEFSEVSLQITNADLMEDADGDFLSDAWELEQFGTLAYDAAADVDGDGFTNLQEFLLGTKANKADSDGDGIVDSLDSTPGSTGDADSDGLPDAWELRHFGDLSQNASGDPDNDLVSNLTEFKQGRTPTKGALPDSNNLTKLVLF